MSMNPLDAAASATALPPRQDAATPTMGRDDFMKLLVSQLRNQDPLDPLQAREMVTQLSQLTGVEKLGEIEDRLGSLEMVSAGMANTQVASLVGKTVSAKADHLSIDTAGGASTPYTLDSGATEVTITIRDQAGRAVRTLQLGENGSGPHTLQWDGNDDAGNRAPAGRYDVEISARDAAGHPVGASSEVRGRVTEVSYENGYPELLVGTSRVLLSDVTSITL